MDSLALAKFVELRDGERVVEFGAGVGVISILLAARSKPLSFSCVEIQKSLFDIMKGNVSANGLDKIISCVCGDFREFALKNRERFDHLIANPPFHRAFSGRLSPDPQRAAARHELNGTIEDLVASARIVLSGGGKFSIVFINSRRGELDRIAAKYGFELNRDDDSLDGIFMAQYSKRIG
ncbi:MAG: methyltransferase [Myxococcales bacterium]|nr:methyltransferase [Myxococcales bacterium]